MLVERTACGGVGGTGPASVIRGLFQVERPPCSNKAAPGDRLMVCNGRVRTTLEVPHRERMDILAAAAAVPGGFESESGKELWENPTGL